MGSIESERESRLAFLRRPDDRLRLQFEAAARKLEDGAKQALQRAWDYAQGLEYSHPGQGKAVYLAHPLRVTTLYMDQFQPADAAGVATAILHNALELTGARRADLAAAAGETVAAAVETLTVDRARQWDDDYKDTYYRAIEAQPRHVARVKILDKLDNLFLLCLNPSADTRQRYLREIERWLIPMARRATPQLADYLSALAEDCRQTGHAPLRGSGWNSN
jgi:(p)ppGpp synthase/HD superfamily hydrolase